MNKIQENNIVYDVLFISLLLIYASYCLPLIPTAAEDFRYVQTFEVDEAALIPVIRHALNNNFDIGHYGYGSMYYNVVIVQLFPLSLTGVVTDRSIVIAGRLASFLPGLISLIALYLLGRKFFNSAIGFMASYLLILTSEFLKWSTISHPETLQIFFIISCMYFIFDYLHGKGQYVRAPTVFHPLPTWKRYIISYFGNESSMVYASMMASLSFNTKWVGIFLWPCLIVAILIKHRENANSARHSLLTVLFCFVIFSVIFVITNPFLFLNLSTAIQQLREISSAISFGVSGFKSDTNGLGWLDVLVSSNMMGVTVFYLSIASFTLFFSGILHRLLTHRRLETLYWKNIILVICILVLSLYLVLFVRYMAGRYILPIVPFAYLLVGQLIWSILQRIHATNSHIGTFFILIFLLSVSYLSESAIDNSLHYRDEFLRRANSPFIYAGEWISEKYPVNTVFSVDKGCYVPSKYQTVYARFGQTEELILRVNPDVICINAEISGRFKNPELRTGYYLGPEEYDKSYAFYRDLRSGSLGTFKLVKNYSDVEIYEKQKNESGVH